MPAAVEVRPTIDRRWLERAAAEQPLTHAYALWDLDRSPQAVRFVSAVRGEETVGYLLLWFGRADRPVVHWFGAADVTRPLAQGLPTPPFVAVVPPDVEPLLAPVFPAGRSSPLWMMVRDGGPPRAGVESVRRLGTQDRPALVELVRARGEPELEAYASVEPNVEPTWGAFDGTRLVGVARAVVRLPRIWVLAGVFVEPASRGRGFGEALVATVVGAADRAGARTGLYVRDEPSVARRLYARLGFRTVGRRSWLDVPPADAG